MSAKVIPYFPTMENLDLINYWLDLHKMAPVTHQALPKIGYFAVVNNMPVAAAFLRTCEGDVSIFDSLVTSKQASSDERHQAIEALTEQIIGDAKRLGFTRMLAFSVNAQTLSRAEARGFKKTPFTVMSCQLSMSEGI